MMKDKTLFILLLIACCCASASAQVCTGSGTINVTVENCLSSSEPADGSIRISPNPAKDFFIVENTGKSLCFELFDPLGRKIRTENLAAGSRTKMDTSGIPPGIYLAVFERERIKKKSGLRVEILGH